MAVSETYIQKLVGLQTQLYAYVLTLLADRAAAEDVLQETNLVLYCKAHEFTEGTNFDAWAFRTARNQCLSYWSIRRRDRLVLDDELLYSSASAVESGQASVDLLKDALSECLAKLPAYQRELVESRYAAGGSVSRLAETCGRSESAISQSLYRIRTALSRCIRGRLSQLGT
jgi:RNA polymerase sigma-70 factor (ECF subfamily)